MRRKIIIIFAAFLFFTATAAEFSQEDIQRYSAYYSNGMEYFKNQQYSSAIIEFRKVLRFSPYDETIQEKLANAYLARAQQYKTETKEYKKALNDYKSAVFYAKYWKQTSPSQSMISLANNATGEISSLEKRLSVAQNQTARLQNAKALKAQGELAASGYDFQLLKNGQYKITAYENLGNIYKNLNNLSSAMDYFKDAISFNPDNPKLHFLYGVMLDEAKNYEASMEQYNLALKYGDKSPELLEILENKWTQNIVNNPNDAQSYINLGAIYQKQGNFEAAKTQYLKAANLDSSDDTSLYNLASLYTQQKNYQEAINIYDKLLLKKPNNIKVLEYKANALKELQRYDETLKQYDKILAIDPNNKNARSLADDIILNHFSGQKLQSYLLAKANSNPTNYEAQFNYALELHKNKNYSGAIEYYKKAQNINPSKEETYLNLAQIYMEQKNYPLANQICEKGLMIIPNNQELKKYLADSKALSANTQYENATKLFNEKKYAQAISEYLKIQNKTKEVNLAIASCYWQMNDYKNANKYYLEILSKEPNDIETLTSSAWAYYSMNDIQNAKITANKILAINNSNQEAKNILKNIEETETSELLQNSIDKYEKGLYNDSLADLNKLLNKNPNDEYGIYYKGLCLDELKKPQEAIKQYKLLISKNPNFASAYYSLAVNLDNSENYKEAISNYEKFISLKGAEKDEMTNFATSRIKELKDYLNALNK